MKIKNQNTAGNFFLVGEALLYAIFPIITAHTTKLMPPILFAALGTLAATVPLFIWLVIRKQFHEVFNKEAFKYIIGVTLFIVVIPSILIFTGSSKTSGINTSLLLNMEIPFTLIICGIFTDEKVTIRKTLGAVAALLGAALIIYNGQPQINWGDLLIIAGTAVFPIGNIFAKKALKKVSSSTILLARDIMGGIILLAISLLFENQSQSLGAVVSSYYPHILVSAILIYWISKVFWYEALKRIDIGKAIVLGFCIYQVFSLILAVTLLKEIPTVYQWMGFTIVIAGIIVVNLQTKASLPQPENI